MAWKLQRGVEIATWRGKCNVAWKLQRGVEIATWRGKSETAANFNVANNELRENSKTNLGFYSVTCLYYEIKEVCIALAYSLDGARKESVQCSVERLNTYKTEV
jgi:hypothetical protein